MATLKQAVISGSSAALEMVKTLLNTPTLIFTGKIGGQSGFPYAVQLQTETHKMSGSASVSESLVIAANSKKYVTDNVAPGAWTWTLSGYIPGNDLFEKTCLFTPFVTFHTELIKNWYKNGYILTYKDIDCQLYQRVVIQSLDIDTQATVKNKTPFSMVLKEINVFEEDKEESFVDKLTGGSLGSTMALGAVMAAASIGASASTFASTVSSYWEAST